MQAAHSNSSVMKMNNIIVVVLVLSVVVRMSTIASDAPHPKYKLCGHRLTDELKKVCSGIYQSINTKRSDNLQDFSDETLIDNYQPLIFNGQRLRRTDFYYVRGIVDECCRQPCTIGTLASYCGII